MPWIEISKGRKSRQADCSDRARHAAAPAAPNYLQTFEIVVKIYKAKEPLCAEGYRELKTRRLGEIKRTSPPSARVSMAIKHGLVTAVGVDTPDVRKGQILATVTLQDILFRLSSPWRYTALMLEEDENIIRLR